MAWTNTDNLQQGLQSFQNGNRAEFASSVVKAFADGGVANISFVGQYQDLTNPPTGAFGVLDPFYTARLRFGYELPLWRDNGIKINQILNRVPAITGATMPAAAAAAYNNKTIALNQIPGTGFPTVEGILVTRLRFDAQRAEFERQIHALVLNVTVAYWNLYQAYGRLYSFEEVMRLSHKAWMATYRKFVAGAKGGAATDYFPVLAQYEEFRGERLNALSQVLEAERNLRGILNINMEDGSRIVPITPPTLAAYRPNWDAAVQDALQLRPELVLARDNIRVTQYNLIAAKNFLKPDLRFTASYEPVGFGTRLDGNSVFVDGTGTFRPDNALRSLSSTHFDDWSLGLTLNVPIGFRLENAVVRSARLGMAQAFYTLADQELRVKRALTQQYQELQRWHELIKARRAERRAYAEAVNAKIQEVIAGQITTGDLGLLDFQRRLANAQVKEYEAIAEYNNSLVNFEWAKGTVLQHFNVSIGEGPLPECAQIRAVENEKRRTAALRLRQRPNPLRHPARMVGDKNLPRKLPGPGDIPAVEPPQPLASPYTQPEIPAPQPRELQKTLPDAAEQSEPVDFGFGPEPNASNPQPQPQPAPNYLPETTPQNFGQKRMPMPPAQPSGMTRVPPAALPDTERQPMPMPNPTTPSPFPLSPSGPRSYSDDPLTLPPQP